MTTLEAGRQSIGGCQRSQHEQPLPFKNYRVMSFAQWCEINNLSAATGRRILASGKGPKVIQLSERRIGIREDHNTEWQEGLVRDAS
jgi:hypothetical protein